MDALHPPVILGILAKLCVRIFRKFKTTIQGNVANVKYRSLQVQDIEPLGDILCVMEDRRRIADATRGLLEAYVGSKRASSHSQYVRVVEVHDKVAGFISANLMSPSFADQILSSGKSEAFFSADVVSTVGDKELKAMNAKTGCTLMFTHYIWGRPFYSLQFAQSIFEKATRWFEGNNITRIVAPMFSRHRGLAKLMLNYMGNANFKAVEGGLDALVLNRPWRSSQGHGNWPQRLLKEYPKNPYKESLTAHQRLNGRLLYEFDFDFDKMCASGCGSWSYNSHRTELPPSDRCPAYAKWQREFVDTYFNSFAEGRSSRRGFVGEIRQLLGSHPDILAL